MIYDKLSNLCLYKGMHPNLDTAIDFLASHSLNLLPLGRTEVDKEKVFINVMEAQAAPAAEKAYEIHKKYMDIQIDLEGIENIQIGDRASMEVQNFDPSSDFGTVNCSLLSVCTLGPGNFIVCMPQEPHMPGIVTGKDCFLKKCVVKVQI